MASLAEMWKMDRGNIEVKKLSQIISFTNDGKILTEETNRQFLEYIQLVDSTMLRKYIDECLTEGVLVENKKIGGYLLQDIVNEIGRRLGFVVECGLLKGVRGHNGYDGKWKDSDGYSIIIECKTTDTYRINLDVIAGYRKQLIEEDSLSEINSSILLVVGREDTGDLEAQIRGSKYAWNTRLISVDSLLRLLLVKENVNDINTVNQIYQALRPQEYTKVDKLIDLIFRTSQDAELDDSEEDNVANDNTEDAGNSLGKQGATHVVEAKFAVRSVERIQKERGVHLEKETRVAYKTIDNRLGVVVLSSKLYEQSQKHYWFGVRPDQIANLEKYEERYIAFGCGSEKKIILMPADFLKRYLDNLNFTGDREGIGEGKGGHWHISIYPQDDVYKLQLNIPKVEFVDVTDFLL